MKTEERSGHWGTGEAGGTHRRGKESSSCSIIWEQKGEEPGDRQVGGSQVEHKQTKWVWWGTGAWALKCSTEVLIWWHWDVSKHSNRSIYQQFLYNLLKNRFSQESKNSNSHRQSYIWWYGYVLGEHTFLPFPMPKWTIAENYVANTLWGKVQSRHQCGQELHTVTPDRV